MRCLSWVNRVGLAVGRPLPVSPSTTGIVSQIRQVRKVPILLQKSAAADGRSAISLGATGFDPPALTLSTQLLRYATHRA
jgi:hypothetical protein